MARAKPAKDEPVEAMPVTLDVWLVTAAEFDCAGYGFAHESVDRKTGVVTQVTTIEGQ